MQDKAATLAMPFTALLILFFSEKTALATPKGVLLILFFMFL